MYYNKYCIPSDKYRLRRSFLNILASLIPTHVSNRNKLRGLKRKINSVHIFRRFFFISFVTSLHLYVWKILIFLSHVNDYCSNFFMNLYDKNLARRTVLDYLLFQRSFIRQIRLCAMSEQYKHCLNEI